MILSTLVNDILKKYQQRLEECETQLKEDSSEIIKLNVESPRYTFILSDITSLNAQIGAYECIVKDLKGLVK